MRHSCEITGYILPFLLSYSSFDWGPVPLSDKLVASSLVEPESGATVLLVNAVEARWTKKGIKMNTNLG